MSGWSRESIISIISTDVTNIHNGVEDFKKSIKENYTETLEYLESVLEQIPNAISGPLIPKTPKVPRKKDIKRIQTIPEDDVVLNESKGSTTLSENSRINNKVDEDPAPGRKRRVASQKAAENIKVQQSLGLSTKLRRPSTDDEQTRIQRSQHSSRAKRTKSIASSSDEEEIKRPTKYTKTNKKSGENPPMIIPKVEPEDTFMVDSTIHDETMKNSTQRESCNKRQREKKSNNMERQASRGSGKNSQEPAAKRVNCNEETMDIPETDITVEPSLYEDAIGKSIPMNSTMNPNCTVTFDRKMMNVTVVLETMQLPPKINETVTLKKSSSNQSSGRNTLIDKEPQTSKNIDIVESPRSLKPIFQTKSSLQGKMKALKETLANEEFDALITDDESSPERNQEIKKSKPQKHNKPQPKEKKYFTRSSLLSEDDDIEEVPATPTQTISRDVNGLKSLKNLYKPNPLFSPYAKDSVKKRVEAFEQAGLQSPKNVEVDAPTRITRTKTRAMTAAEANVNQTQGPSIAQKMARKSLAKAKKISLTKQMKEFEESKENNVMNSAQKPNRLLAINEKMAQKQQQRTTPVSKSRLQMPMSVNRIHHTPAGSQIQNQSKAMTASRANIVTSVDSFLSAPRTLTKSNSSDNLAEKRRKVNDEDAKRKREETLKALSEEKRRKREEKELKNKLAREAKEKLDMEKRLKQEREREEKARAALLLQEKMREESERKRLVQLQRAQEKEERRKQEEQLRLQRLQEQEEAERQLAEQKRREQDAERRKAAEARAQQIAAAEAARMKAHYIAKKNAEMKQQHDPSSYILDSEPDDDESDDEARPKHSIPHWAKPNVRALQLAIQQYIPMAPVLQFFGTKRCTPDLTDLFKGIKKERLQRTSSAIWKTPPRYSMMTNE